MRRKEAPNFWSDSLRANWEEKRRIEEVWTIGRRRGRRVDDDDERDGVGDDEMMGGMSGRAKVAKRKVTAAS